MIASSIIFLTAFVYSDTALEDYETGAQSARVGAVLVEKLLNAMHFAP